MSDVNIYLCVDKLQNSYNVRFMARIARRNTSETWYAFKLKNRRLTPG